MKKPIYILGINESHGATAALLKNGKIVACATEERFTRTKNQSSYPKKAIAYCLEQEKISSRDLDGVYLGFLHPISLMLKKRKESGSWYKPLSTLSSYIQQITNISPKISYFFFKIRETIFLKFFFKTLQNKHRKEIAQKLHVDSKKIIPVDHETAHAYAAYYSAPSEIKQNKALVISIDGAGDNVCSRIFKVEGGSFKEIASTPNVFSLGILYLYVTSYLAMKPNEHEYKVMGLAPYSHKQDAEKVLKIFREIMWVNKLRIKAKIPHVYIPYFLEKKLKGYRFDAIAGGIQSFCEEMLITLVKNSVSKTKIRNVFLGGGLFMNVKANMLISKLASINTLFVMPGATDESTAIGAAYFGYRQACDNKGLDFIPQELTSVYLGPSSSNKDIVKALTALKNNKNFRVTKMKNPAKTIADLLTQGKIVARFSGRMEYGPRALGNRSILARSDDRRVIRIINDQIKGRDFWMPFAPVILFERRNDYLVVPKNIDSPYMMIAFESTILAKKELIATLHPYDYTARPQILSRDQNRDYYAIIKEFEKKTGIGGLLNTSFNIHGIPIVCTPKDAIYTLTHSGLKYLALENYLIVKSLPL